MNLTIALSLGIFISSGIVYLMSELIAIEQENHTKVNNPAIEFSRTIKDSESDRRKGHFQKTSKTKITPKQPKSQKIVNNKPAMDSLSIPDLNLNNTLKGMIPFGRGSSNGEVMYASYLRCHVKQQ